TARSAYGTPESISEHRDSDESYSEQQSVEQMEERWREKLREEVKLELEADMKRQLHEQVAVQLQQQLRLERQRMKEEQQRAYPKPLATVVPLQTQTKELRPHRQTRLTVGGNAFWETDIEDYLTGHLQP